MTVQLGRLLANTKFTAARGLDAQVEIGGVTADSRRVKPGHLFCAVAGAREDGARYIEEALSRGAVAVAGRRELREVVDARASFLAVDDDRAAYGRLCDRFFGEPSARLGVIGVTGTNGKSTTTGLVAAVLGSIRGGCARLGTVDVDLGDGVRPSSMTTPAPEDLHAMLAEAAGRGLDCAVMEVSSHALDQGRADAVRFAVAVYTSVGRDHLDYHGSLERYRAAKARLADLLEAGSTLVLNQDDPFVRGLRPAAGVRVLRYSSARPAAAGADLFFEVESESARGTRGQLCFEGRRAPVATSLFGEHNRENLLAAAAAGLAMGHELDAVAAGLGRFEGVVGRLDRVELATPFDCFIDYAHTPDAFDRVLASLAEIALGRLILVFGCGGEKDRGKRPLMGALAERHADLVVLTADNPRAEDAADIVEDIRSGMEWPEGVRVILDRRGAIHAALDLARPGDLVLIAGKGHEGEQVIGERRFPWSDRAVVTAWRNEFAGDGGRGAASPAEGEGE